jgi:hypothetical protein
MDRETEREMRAAYEAYCQQKQRVARCPTCGDERAAWAAFLAGWQAREARR